MSEVAEMVPIAGTVEKSIKDELEALAKQNERSLSAEVRIALRAHLAQAEAAA